jgi:hypothetical protein
LVSLDLLSSLDGLVWLQSGELVGKCFQQHQTTVSRNHKKCADVFGIELIKRDGIWSVEGPSELLNLERNVHQLARFKGQALLRLESNSWISGALSSPSPESWITGSCKPQGVKRCVDLIHQRIIDAWLCPSNEAPLDEPGLTIYPLCTVPMRLMVASDHPLLKWDVQTLEQVKKYPWRQISRGAYPQIEKLLKSLDLWPSLKQHQYLDKRKWGGLEKQSTILQVGSVLSQQNNQIPLTALSLDLGAETGVVLVTRKDKSKHDAIQNLKTSMRIKLKDEQKKYPEICINMQT